MSKLEFNLKPVDEKPSRRYRKGSKYDRIIDAFMEGSDILVAVEVPDKDGNKLRIPLNKRIEARGLRGVRVSVFDNVCYLEKGKSS
jgi:hypothetical protein